MTSKEAYIKLSNHLKYNSSPFEIAYIQQDNCCKSKNEVIDCLETIKKDLEILEILKPYLKIESGYNAIMFEDADSIVMLPLKDSEIKIIGEWLDK